MSSKSGEIDLVAAARLVLARKTLKVKQEVIAGACGVSLGWISHMEVGRRPISFEVLKGLCLAYRINPAYILTGEAPMILGKVKNDNYLNLSAEVETLKAQVKKLVNVGSEE